MAKNQSISAAAARNVRGALGGLCELTVDNSTGKTFTVTKWEGQYIKITPLLEGIYYVFSEVASLASALSTSAEADDATSPGSTIPDATGVGVPAHEVVPSRTSSGGEMYLHVLSQSSTDSAVRVRLA